MSEIHSLPVLRPLRAAGLYLLAITPSVAGTSVWARLQTPPPPLAPLAAGWAVALALALPTFWIKQTALGRDARGALAWILGGNVVRALTLLLIVVAVLAMDMAHSAAFLVAAISGYLCGLAGEVFLLHRASQRLWMIE